MSDTNPISPVSCTLRIDVAQGARLRVWRHDPTSTVPAIHGNILVTFHADSDLELYNKVRVFLTSLEVTNFSGRSSEEHVLRTCLSVTLGLIHDMHSIPELYLGFPDGTQLAISRQAKPDYTF